jgi:hypothetical protein
MFSLNKVTILCLILLMSCQTKTPLTREQTMLVLTDAMRLEASQQVAYNYLLLPDSIWQKQYDFVLKKHGISEQDFETTLLYYKQHGQEFADLMSDVVEILDAESKQEFIR